MQASYRALSKHLTVADRLALAVALVAPFGQALAQAPAIQHYNVANLTSNLNSLAPVMDPHLVNPWGLSRSSGGAWWVSDNGTGLSTLYDGSGQAQSLVVKIPAADPSGTGNPTGTMFNGDVNSFQVAPGKQALFLFVTEDGTISGWNPAVNLTSAIIMVNTKGKSVFKGATVATVDTPHGPQAFLYAADFRRGKIAVYDAAFNPVRVSEENFEDDSLPEGYAPFNIQNIGGNLYVTYAKRKPGSADEVDGPGLGYVDVFSSKGTLLHRLEHGSWLNAPWGLTLASGDFGAHSHDVLVGQFGSGLIQSFDSVTGTYKGPLNGPKGTPIEIDGIWALAFGGGPDANGPATTLFYTAGPDHERNGVFGTVTAVENLQGNDR